MYKSNSGFRLSRNRFCFLIKYIANQNISAFKSATALILTVVYNVNEKEILI